MAHRFFALSLGLLLLSACELIPQRLTDCSATRPCAGGQLCDPETSRCIEMPDLGAELDADTAADFKAPECTGTCQACQLHSDCPSLVCDDYLRSGDGGTCVPTSEVVYVDNRGGACGNSGSGDAPASALCTVAEALPRIDGVRKRVIRLLPSTRDYGTLAIADRDVEIFGPAGQGGRAQFQGGGATDAVTVSGSAHVVLSGVDIFFGKAGLICQGNGATSVTLRQSSVRNCSDIGLLSSNCSLDLDRVLISDNQNGALAIGGSQSYLVTNSYIVRNHSLALPAIKLSSTASGTFRFNTVADNNSEVAAGVECSSFGVTISDSIVFRNSRLGNSQLQNCRLHNTAVGRSDGALGIHEDPMFAPIGGIDYGLDGPMMSNSCCIDRSTNSLRTDYFGNLRPRGRASDIGAHEAR